MRSVSMTRDRHAAQAMLARFALGGLGTYVVLLVAAHLLRTDLDPASRFVSEYAVGPFGFLVTASFFVLGASSAAVAVVALRVRSSGSTWIGAILLLIWSIAVALSGVFPTDLQGGQETFAGRVHNELAMVAFPSVLAASLVLSLGLWRTEASVAVKAARLVLGLAAFVVLACTVAVLGRIGLVGVGQRVFLGLILAWLALTAWQAR